MKRALLFVLAMVSVLSSVHAEGIGSWLDTVHNFGSFKEESGDVTCKMKMVNIGNSELRITNVRPTCGCTASQYTVRPIVPGDTAIVILTYNPKNRPGRFEKDVYVYTDGNPEKSILTIKGNVIGSPATINAQYPIGVGALKLEKRIIPFGPITKGKSRTQFIAVYNQSEDSVTATFLDIPKHLEVEMIPDTVAPGEQATITVTYRTALNDEWGLAQDQFIMETHSTNVVKDGVAGIAKIDVTAILNESFKNLTDEQLLLAPVAKYSPTKVDFGKISVDDEEVRETIKITNEGKTKLNIRRIYSLDDGVMLSCKKQEIKPGRSAEIEIKIAPAKLKGILNAKVTVITNDPENPVQEIRLVGQLININR